MPTDRITHESTVAAETSSIPVEPFEPEPIGSAWNGSCNRWSRPDKRAQAVATVTPLFGWVTMTDDVTDNAEFETVVELLDDEFAREILIFTSMEPMTVQELSNRSDASPSTLYRRVERLQETELLVEQPRIRSDGHHDTVYAAALEQVRISLANGEFTVHIDRSEEDAADRLRRLWGDL